jgi:pilus assembly protein Flp/PilA
MLNMIVAIVSRLQRDEKGASAVEYAVLVGAIGVAVAAAVAALQTPLTAAFTNIVTKAGL